MGGRDEAAVLVRTEPDPLHGRGAVPDAGEHLLAGQRELDGTALDHVRGHRRKHGVGVGQPLGPEPAADVQRHDPHPFPVDAEEPGDQAPDGMRALRGLVEREMSVLPDGDAGVRFHRVVVLQRRRVRLVQRDCRRGERLVHVAFFGVRGEAGVELVGSVQVVPVGRERRVVRLLVVGDPDEVSRVAGDLEGLRDDGAYVLAAKGDLVGLQYRQFPVARIGQRWCVLVGDHRDHAG